MVDCKQEPTEWWRAYEQQQSHKCWGFGTQNCFVANKHIDISFIIKLVSKMPSVCSARSRDSTLMVAAAVLLLSSSICWSLIAAQGNQAQQQVCPEQNDIAPCVCTVKKNGLDILCETTDLAHITRSMGTLKGKSPIIFYLKLRHNNLPKLQGFVFLALDIRHLTIHNSSLAAIEENALSSLGE